MSFVYIIVHFSDTYKPSFLAIADAFGASMKPEQGLLRIACRTGDILLQIHQSIPDRSKGSESADLSGVVIAMGMVGDSLEDAGKSRAPANLID